jgi:NAD(P)-dependent dehydrogenase (short-subunit alcohol dehydrogenase family)
MEMAGRLDGKVALITGGCSGIGLGTLERFVAEGARVVVADLQDGKGALLEERFPGRVRFAHCNVALEDDIRSSVELAVSTFGGLDILYNNAGHGGVAGGVEDIEAQGWDDTFALLVRGPVLGMKHAVPHLKARGGGSIINTASVAGSEAGWAPMAYSVAKSAVIHLSRIAAAELSPQNIRVNTISPGLIATAIFGATMEMPPEAAEQLAARVAEVAPRMQPIPKAGMPIDIAEAALFLASDASTFVTGTNMVVDGGVTVGSRHSWAPDTDSPYAELLGVIVEQAEVLQLARRRL